MADIDYDLVVVGGGVLGTFHAYHAMKKGLKVALLEKDSMPKSATVRNFGQVVPSGMNTKWQEYGRKSLKIYKKIHAKFNITVRQEGSIYLASNEEEVQLIEELREINRINEYTSILFTKAECLSRYPGLNENYVKAGLFFPEEITVEPRTMIGRIHKYLQKKGLSIFYQSKVIECYALGNEVTTQLANGRMLLSSKVIICNGSDFKTLYPQLFATSDLEISKLQMMQTKPQENYKIPGSVLTGLSIRRYEAFAECPSYLKIKSKELLESPEKKWGVHILFKQAMDGSVILGDSHEYADAENIDDLGFDLNMEIDNLMIKKAKEIFELPTYEINQRWFGMYSQCKNSDIFERTIDRNIHIVTGIGGKGMTGSAGFAKHNINQIFNI
ncbi:TIGR03364 family FAD-dependent oxidoreductase [Maribacter stanieri]|uniref:FAD dependent oxidoreductase TIGR03364 n=1 Tax=Maribacter stanieri TaxID=440514 RepID=A0A1I6IE43_9FLAO|nr:TIGR03364 family FAD-dependent oxidoreductase [Maribacter stanieri]SFR65002.1 FAD dependent oxidoreductase TIGR03364 [Maribacter stanieri]